MLEAVTAPPTSADLSPLDRRALLLAELCRDLAERLGAVAADLRQDRERPFPDALLAALRRGLLAERRAAPRAGEEGGEEAILPSGGKDVKSRTGAELAAHRPSPEAGAEAPAAGAAEAEGAGAEAERMGVRVPPGEAEDAGASVPLEQAERMGVRVPPGEAEGAGVRDQAAEVDGPAMEAVIIQLPEPQRAWLGERLFALLRGDGAEGVAASQRLLYEASPIGAAGVARARFERWVASLCGEGPAGDGAAPCREAAWAAAFDLFARGAAWLPRAAVPAAHLPPGRGAAGAGPRAVPGCGALPAGPGAGDGGRRGARRSARRGHGRPPVPGAGGADAGRGRSAPPAE